MEFRKMVTIILYARQQKRHWCIEQSFGLCGRGRGWDDLAEWHWNMYNIWNELPVQVRCTILDTWGWCTGKTQRDGTGREEGSGWGTRVYLWRIHVYIWQNQCNIVKLKNKIKKKKYSLNSYWLKGKIFMSLNRRKKLKENPQNIFSSCFWPQRKKERKVLRIDWSIFYEQRCFIWV